jgi:type II secretory pathway pseudopilin PulG
MYKQKSSLDRRRAFTLIEIMVAAAITIVMIGLVIQITGEVLKLWNRSMGKLSANAEARIAMELLTSDLEAAMLRNDGMLWLYSVDDGNLPSIGDYSPKTITLAMFTTAQDRPQQDQNGNSVPGNICTVQYQLVYQNPVTGEDSEDSNAFALHRRLIDPVTTFADFLGAGNQENFDKWLELEYSVSSDVSLSYTEYPVPSDPNYYLAGNIVDFQVEFFVIDADGVAQSVPPSTAVYYGGKNGVDGDSIATVGPFQNVTEKLRYPIEYADISMTIVSSEGMNILRNLLAGRGGTGYSANEADKVILQHGEIFKRRVHFQAKPL